MGHKYSRLKGAWKGLKFVAGTAAFAIPSLGVVAALPDLPADPDQVSPELVGVLVSGVWAGSTGVWAFLRNWKKNRDKNPVLNYRNFGVLLMVGAAFPVSPCLLSVHGTDPSPRVSVMGGAVAGSTPTASPALSA